jgi:hypothetical protein
LLLNGKRPWRGNLKERYEELVNTFVNTPRWGEGEKRAGTDIVVGGNGFEPMTSAMICQRFCLNCIRIIGNCRRQQIE